MSKLEVKIEEKVVEYAVVKYSCMVLKLNVWGRRGWPDRLFLLPGPKMIFIEFKRASEEPRKLQEYVHGRLRALGFRVEVVDNVSDGKCIIDDFASNNPHV